MLCIIVVQVPAGTVQVLGAGALQLMDLERVGHLYGRDQAILLQENEVWVGHQLLDEQATKILLLLMGMAGLTTNLCLYKIVNHI